MPYESESQRRWAHTKRGTKALGGKQEVEKWDKESKGKELPEVVSKDKENDMKTSDAHSELLGMLSVLDSLEERLEKEPQPEFDADGILSFKRDFINMYEALTKEQNKQSAVSTLNKMKQLISKMRQLSETAADKDDVNKFERMITTCETKVNRM